MSFAPSASPATPISPKKLPEIITIPEQFYGVALKLKSLTSAERDAAAHTPPPAPAPKPVAIVKPPESRRTPWAMIGVVAGVILLSAAGFVYFNRDILFRKPAPAPIAVAPEPIPMAPSGLSASASQGAVSLSWVDAATNEQGYHIERRENVGDASSTPFTRITTLPPNSNAFIDVTVLSGAGYVYRVIAAGASGDSAPSNEATAATPMPPAPEAPKPTLPPGGLDTDSDGLTDIEETVYGTNPQRPDSDNDHFLDGNEVFHLYNPAAAAPGKLIESGLVRMVSSTSGWTMYVPTAWVSGPDVADPNRLAIQTGRGESFIVSVESNPAKQDLLPWVASRINQPVESLGDFTTKGGLQGVYSPDRMQAWLSWGDAVFHIVYDLKDQPFVNFRTTLEMMLNSLRLNGAAVFPITLTPANSGPGSLLNLPTSSTGITPSDTAIVATSTPATESSTNSSTTTAIPSSTSTSP